jgi:regulatory protein
MRRNRRGAEAPDAGPSRPDSAARAPDSIEGRPAGRPLARASSDALASFGRSTEDPFRFDPGESFDAHDRARGAGDAPAAGEDVYTRTSQSPRRGARRATARESFDDVADGTRQAPARSLKARAIGYLSRREYSRVELARKLAPYVEEGDDPDALLDALEREGWLSDARFVESLVNRRASRVGSARIMSELKRHALDDALVETVGAQLRENEFARAQAVWRKKFGTLPQSPAERAKQARFLAMRGFSSGTIVKLLKGDDDTFGDA